MRFKKIFGISLLLISISLAQYYSSQDWITSILSTIFGELPSSCNQALDPECLKCMGISKLVPFMFFLAIFYFVFYFVFMQVFGKIEVSTGPIREVRPGEIPLTAKRIAVLVSLALAIGILHFQPVASSLKQMIFWIGISFIILAYLVGLSFVKFSGNGKGSPVFATIIFFIILIALFGYIWSYISPSLEEWESLCT